MEEHWQALADSFNEDALDSRKRDDGDVEISIAETGEIISAEYRAPYLAHAPLEPISAIVRVDEDGAEVWTGTQIPRFIQNNVGKIAGIDPKGQGPCALYGRQLRPPAGGRGGQAGNRDRRPDEGHAGQADLFARRRHEPRFHPPDRHGADARRGQRRQGRGL
jgi:xanthine dehydrogenase molybdopterin-binding subunit B